MVRETPGFTTTLSSHLPSLTPGVSILHAIQFIDKFPPLEWPWAVLIYDQGDNYRASGALVDNDVVVTVAHKVLNYVDRASSLKVRLGDWNPNGRDAKEDFDFVEREVDCVITHPEEDLTNTLANNVAVLKLRPRNDNQREKMKQTVRSAITLKSAEEITVISADDMARPGNKPEGVEGTRIISKLSSIDVRLGLVTNRPELDGLGNNLIRNSALTIIEERYINTICLPDEFQFRNYRDRCWVASWGDK